MIAASLGAKKVYAVEANEHMAKLAQKNIYINGFSDKIEVLANARLNESTCRLSGCLCAYERRSMSR